MRPRPRRRDWRISRMYGFIRSRQLDGTLNQGPRVGTYVITAHRIHAGWGTVSETRFPYPKGKIIQWPPVEQEGLDEIAKYNKHFFHFLIRNLDDARRAISQRDVFLFSIPIHAGWRKSSDGVIEMPTQVTPITENHAVVAVGYNDNTQLLTFLNCWGRHWGDKGFGYLPYRYFTLFLQEASTVLPHYLDHWGAPRTRPLEFAIQEKTFENVLGNPCVAFDAWDVRNDVRIGWCFATRRDGWLEVEDFFVRPGYQDRGHLERLLSHLISFGEEVALPIRFWIHHADTHWRSANFPVMNAMIRLANLNVRPSGVTWAAYLGEMP
jgi:hypothetical protein